jgi:hypothetical protein
LSFNLSREFLTSAFAGCDAYAVDREAAGLLGLDWRHIGHLI